MTTAAQRYNAKVNRIFAEVERYAAINGDPTQPIRAKREELHNAGFDHSMLRRMPDHDIATLYRVWFTRKDA